MQTIEYRTIDKTAWGDGPWLNEPDKKQWQDVETGLPCLAVRNRSGAWCGYVGVPQTHPWHGYDDRHELIVDTINVHGGLTFSSACAHGEDESQGICHRPDPGEPDNVWWFGFDCAHWNDLSPAYQQAGLPDCAQYRTLLYVERQVSKLARQLLDQGRGAGD